MTRDEPSLKSLQNQDVCAELTRHYAKSFYLASTVLPKEKRAAAFAVYAFCRVSDNIVDQPGNYPKEELDEWRADLKKAFRKEQSPHPVLDAFVKTCTKYAIPHHLAYQLLDGMQMDLVKFRYETFDELYDYAYKVASIPGLMMLHIMGYRDPQAKKYAIKLGIAMQITNVVRDIREDFENGKIYLPQEDLRAFGYSEQDLKNGVQNQALDELITFEIERGLCYYHRSEPGIPMISADSRLCLIICWVLYRHILKEMNHQRFKVIQHRTVVPSWRKMLLLAKSQLLLWTKFSGGNKS